MQLKPLIGIIAILAVLVGIAYRLSPKHYQQTENVSIEGQALLAPKTLENTAKIILQGQDSEPIELQKQTVGLWTIPDYHGLPINFSKLRSLIRELAQAKLVRPVTDDPKRIQGMEIGTYRVQLKEAGSNAPIWSLETGKQGPSGGVFIRLNDQAQTFLADLNLYVDTTPDSWVDKKVLDFHPQEVAQLKITFPDKSPALELTRSEATAPFTAKNLPKGLQVKQSEALRIVNTLTQAYFNQLIENNDPDAKSARSNPRLIVLKLFNGEEYTLKIGRSKATQRQALAKTAPEQPTDKKEKKRSFDVFGRKKKALTPRLEEKAPQVAKQEKKESPRPTFIFYESASMENAWQKAFAKVSLVYPESVFSILPKNRSALLEPVPKPTKGDSASQSEK